MPTGFLFIISVITLATVTVPAQHLQVIDCGMTALRPRNDMVALHILITEVQPAMLTDTFLFLIRLHLL